MKRKKTGKSSNAVKSTICMVKQPKGDPRILYVDDFDGVSVALKPVKGEYDNPLWFPREIVFEANRELFGQLEKAYMQGNQDALERLWSHARRWKPE